MPPPIDANVVCVLGTTLRGAKMTEFGVWTCVGPGNP